MGRYSDIFIHKLARTNFLVQNLEFQKNEEFSGYEDFEDSFGGKQ